MSIQGCQTLSELSDGEYLRLLSQKAEEQSIPLLSSIELTERCNLQCVHCYLGDQQAIQRKRDRELSTEQWKGILDQIAAIGCLRLTLTGGDPLLRVDFAEIYSHARKLGLMVTVLTNGTLIEDSLIELFAELPPYKVEVTLYGARATTYEAITGVPGSFERCLAGIERLRACNVALSLKTVLLRANQHEFLQIGELGRRLGNRQFRHDLEIQAGLRGDRLPLSARLDPDRAVEVEFSSPEVIEAWRRFYRVRQGVEVHSRRLYQCGAATRSFHIDPYGQLNPCVSVRHVGCDLLQEELGDGLEIIRGILAEKPAPPDYPCNDCPERSVCNACPAFSFLETGCEEKPAEFLCQVMMMRRTLIEQRGGI